MVAAATEGVGLAFSVMTFSAALFSAMAWSTARCSAVGLAAIVGFEAARLLAGGNDGGSGIGLADVDDTDFGGGAGVNVRIGGGDGIRSALAVSVLRIVGRLDGTGLAIVVSGIGLVGWMGGGLGAGGAVTARSS